MKRIRNFLTPSFAGNIPRFFVFRALYNFMLFLPVWVIFLQRDHRLSLTQVTFVDFAFWITMAITEVPTGAVADTLGRKLSNLIGVGLTAVSLLLFGLTPDYTLLLVANSLWAVAMTFISGADLALFYDTLKALGREEEYQNYRGRLQAVTLVSIAVSSGLGGLLGAYDLRATFTVTAALLVVAFVVVLLLKEPPHEPDLETGKRLGYLGTLRITWQTILHQPGLRYALAYSNLVPLVGSAIQATFIQPYAVEVGLPIVILGIVSLGLRLFQIAGSTYSARLVKFFGEWRWLLIAPLFEISGVLALGGMNGPWGILVFAVSGLTISATTPLIESLILRQTPGNIRATILSVDSLIFRLMLALIGPLLGILGDRAGIPYAFVAAAGGTGFLVLLTLLFWMRLKPPLLAVNE
jgi:MFS family permease